MHNDLNQFIRLSKYAGERFDLTQSAGGNTSVQLKDGTFLVKSSGINMTEVGINKGFVRLRRKSVIDILTNKKMLLERNLAKQENIARQLLDKTQVSGHGRPSIEAYMHVLFDKFTLHTHPLAVNIVACQKNWKEAFLKMFPQAVCVEYATPGIRLALAIQSVSHRAKVIFIQNHGLIVTGPTAQSVINLTEKVISTVEKKIGCNFTQYKLTTEISTLINRFAKMPLVSYLSSDAEILKISRSSLKLFLHQPFSPDGITFCGVTAVRIRSTKDAGPIRKYFKQHKTLPKVIIYKGHIFCIAPNLRKAKEIEDILKFQLMVLSKAGKKAQPLSKSEMHYLTHWEAETYRQQL